MLAHFFRVRLQLFLVDHVEHRQADRARHGAAAERAEELHPVVERRGNLWRRHHRTNRIAVADRLPEDDDVGYDALRLKTVAVRANAAVGGLHLIGDADAARLAHVAVDGGEIPRWKDDLSPDAGAALRDEPAEASAGRVDPIDQSRNGVNVG